MPELPEVETVVRGLRKAIMHQTIKAVDTSEKQLRIPYPTGLKFILKNKKIIDIIRLAKYIIIHTDSLKLVLHLGMSGRLLFNMNGASSLSKHDHVVFKLSNGELIFNDARRFGLVTLVTLVEDLKHKLFAHLGIDPFAEEFTCKYLYALTKKSRASIKAFLMNAKCIAGIGNIYACESLFRAQILPNRAAFSLSKVEVAHLHQSIIKVLSEAIGSGGSTLKDYVHADGNIGRYQSSFNVYGREGSPCCECRHLIEKLPIAGRSSFYCSNCQR